ncbi:MAG TPA: hypothetical protein VH969_21505 [Actinophytocola sp.]|jgi:hypothetical protein|uniref:hypothetical protein n=1 Tax=Actinophytocola sp. TaxID=1872138 RepID=UPI002F94007B
MRRARIIALVAVPVLLFGAGCRGEVGSGSAPPGGSGGTGGTGGGDGQVEQEFNDIESTLNSIESEMSEDGR